MAGSESERPSRFTDTLKWKPYPPRGDPKLVRRVLLRLPNGYDILMFAGDRVVRAAGGTFEVAVIRRPASPILRYEQHRTDDQVREIVEETRKLKPAGSARLRHKTRPP